MKLKVKDGQLTYGSAYKLFVVSWICGMGAFFTLMFALIFGIMLISGSGTVNGEEVTSRASILTSAMTSIILIPVIVVVHAFMFGGILLFGTWIFRRRGKLTIEGHDAPSAF